MQESAFVKPPWLIERQGEGYLQVPKPLYRVAERADGEHTVGDIAREVGESEGLRLSADNVRQLIATQLMPNGVVPTNDGTVLAHPKSAGSALAIARMKQIDAAGLAGITGALRLVYWPPVPGFILLMLVAIIVSAGFHELGHAAALRYGGGTPRTFASQMPPLKWWARAVFVVYVLVTIPALVVLLVLMVRSLPRVVATAWAALGDQGSPRTGQRYGCGAGRPGVCHVGASVAASRRCAEPVV
jgi:hypothetical protein